jgi:hypothetical protein
MQAAKPKALDLIARLPDATVMSEAMYRLAVIDKVR